MSVRLLQSPCGGSGDDDGIVAANDDVDDAPCMASFVVSAAGGDADADVPCAEPPQHPSLRLPQRQTRKKKRQELCEAYRAFAGDTSAHGFRWTVGCRDPLGKVLWPCLITMALLAAFGSVWSVSRDYLEGPNYASEYSLISGEGHSDRDAKTNENGTKSPGIIICSPNPWDRSKIDALNISYEMVSYMTYILRPFHGNPALFSDERRLGGLERRYRRLLRDRFGGDLTALLDAVSVGCTDFVSRCRVGLDIGLSGEECCGRVFDPAGVYTFDGKCFTTQGVLEYFVFQPGKAQGVTVVVRVSDSASDFSLDRGVVSWPTMPGRGVAFAVADRAAHPNAALMSAGRSAKANTVTDVAIGLETIDFSHTQYPIRRFLHGEDACIDTLHAGESGDLEGSNLVPGFDLYSMDNCKMGRVQRAINFFYGCNVFPIPVHCDKLPFCSPLESAMFYRKHLRRSIAKGQSTHREFPKIPYQLIEGKVCHLETNNPAAPLDFSYAFSHLHEDVDTDGDVGIRLDEFDAPVRERLPDYVTYSCPRDCLHHTYKTTVSSMDLAKDMTDSLVHDRLDGQKPDSSQYAMLEFFFPSFDFVRIVQHSRGPLEWLADVGGSLGLYMGASLFTLVEIFWFAWKFALKLLVRVFKKCCPNHPFAFYNNY